MEEKIEVEYVPEKAEIEDTFLEDFKKVFEKFSFSDSVTGAEVGLEGIRILDSECSNWLDIFVRQSPF